MEEPKLPENEEERLAAVAACALLDSACDPSFDQITRLAAQIAETPIALISVIDRERQWFKSRCGLDVTELSRALSFCGHAILGAEPMIVHDTLQDRRFRDNPLVSAAPHIRFYAGIPIRLAGGHAIGTLCVIDHRPRTLDDRQLRLLGALARQIEVQVELQHRLARHASESADRTVADSAPALEVPFRLRVHPHVELEYLGGAFTKLSGYPAERFTGSNRRGAVLLHPEDAPLFTMLLSSPERFERPLLLRWRMADGRYRWIEHETRPVEENGVLVAIEGVARPPRGALEDAAVGAPSPPLAQAAPPDAILLLTDEGAFRFVSANARELLGGARIEAPGSSLLEVVHPDDRDRAAAALATTEQRPERHELRLRQADGRHAAFDVILQRLGADEPGLLVQLRDRGAWLRAQDELARREALGLQLALSRQHMASDLQALHRRHEELTALIVHDLKTPLTAIMMNAHLMLEEARSLGRPTSSPRDVLLSAEIMQRMVMNFLDVSRAETGGLRPEFREVDVGRIVDDAARRLTVPLEAKQQRLTIDSELADPRISADPQLLSRVLQNLLDHGSHHAPAGSTLTVRLGAGDGDRISLAVADRGPEVPDRHKTCIFDPSMRLEGADDLPRTSRGLGLAFCQLAVGAHLGRIWIEDEPGGGCCVRVDLPRRPPQPTPL